MRLTARAIGDSTIEASVDLPQAPSVGEQHHRGERRT
jgi:hypothetical protein